MISFTVQLFAGVRELAGADGAILELPAGATVAALRLRLIDLYPRIDSLLTRSAVAVNREFASDELVLADGDEVAIVPPVSGG